MEIVEERRVALAPLLIKDIICIVIIVGIFWLLRDLIRYATTRMTLTKSSLETKRGLINTSRTNSPLDKINDIRVESGLWGKIFNYGTIVVNTAGRYYYFPGIYKANSFVASVRNEIEVYKEEAMKKNARIMAEAIKGQ